MAAITKAAEVASANEPNSSVPDPTTSLTLSPTLLAMIAGLETAYLKSLSNLPIVSHPTSTL